MGIFSSREEPSQQQSSQQVAGQASSSPSNEAWQNSQATWVPDQASPNCQLCEAPFGMWLWRHHCRQCGALVCYHCSLYKAMATGFLTPQKVCTRCFVTIANASARSSKSGSKAGSRRGSASKIVPDASQSTHLHSEAHTEQRVSTDSTDTATSTSSISFTVSASALPPASSSSSSSSHPPPSSSPASSIRKSSPAPTTSSPRSSMVRKASPAPAAGAAAATSPAQTGRRRSSISGLPAFQAPVAETTPTNAAATVASGADALPSSSPSTPVYLPIESLSCEALFNRLGGFGSLLVLDLRSAEDYKASHVPRSLNLPMSEGDLIEVNAEEVAGALTTLEQRMHKTDQRAFRMRQRCSVVLVGHPAEDADSAAADSASPPNFSLTPLLSLSHSRLSLHLARLLTLEGKVATVCAVSGGFAAFQEVYPFVCCAYSQREMASGQHIHRKPFPWYPCEILISPSIKPRAEDMRIYLGSKVDAANREHLAHLKVTHILNCTEEVPNTFENATDGGSAITYKRLNLCDEVTVRITDVFAEAFDFLDAVGKTPEGGRVLVHCAEGISRSATVVIAYLMRTYGLSLHAAYSHAKNQRKQVFPNLGFWKQLDALEKELYESASPKRTEPYRSTMADCIDMALLTEEYKARKAMAEGGASSSSAISTDTMIVTPPPGASPNGTWKLSGVAGADAKQRSEEAIVEEAQCPIGPIITAE